MQNESIEKFLMLVDAVYGGRVDAVLLTGSRANGYAHPSSDVDIHIVVNRLSDKDAKGLYKFDEYDLEFHTIAVSRDDFIRASSDSISQTMENVALTLFRYDVLRGSDFIASVRNSVVEAEINAANDWLQRVCKGPITLSSLPRDVGIALLVMRKLAHAPPLNERLERKIRKVGYDITIRDISLNLPDVLDATTRQSVRKEIYPALASVMNLAALSSRHGKLAVDTKAIRGMLLYGIPFLFCVLVDPLFDYRRVKKLVRHEVAKLGKGSTADGILKEYIEEASSFVKFARRKRNDWKDQIV